MDFLYLSAPQREVSDAAVQACIDLALKMIEKLVDTHGANVVVSGGDSVRSKLRTLFDAGS